MRQIKSRIKFFILLIAIILFMYLGRLFHIDISALQNSLKKFPLLYAGAIFIILYVVVTFFLWLSKDIFRFAGAIFFGAYLSTFLIWIAEVLNALILFNLSRYLGRGFLEHALKGGYRRLDEKLAKSGFLWLFIFRITPLIPFRFFDLACGLTQISFVKFLITVILASPLRILWLQYAIAGVGEAALKNPSALVEYLCANRPLFIFSLIYFLLILLIAFKLRRKG